MILQAIVTKYFAPTDKHGPRVKATAAAGSVTLDWDDSFNNEQNHATVARALAVKFEWHGRWYGGGLPDGVRNAYVCAPFGGSDGAAFTIKPSKAVRS